MSALTPSLRLAHVDGALDHAREHGHVPLATFESARNHLAAVVAEHSATVAELKQLRAEREATAAVPPECPVCGRTDVTLTKVGRMRSHSGDIWIGGWRQICKGVGELPKNAAPQQPAPDGEVRCGPACSEMHTYEPGRCEAAVQAGARNEGTP